MGFWECGLEQFGSGSLCSVQCGFGFCGVYQDGIDCCVQDILDFWIFWNVWMIVVIVVFKYFVENWQEGIFGVQVFVGYCVFVDVVVGVGEVYFFLDSGVCYLFDEGLGGFFLFVFGVCVDGYVLVVDVIDFWQVFVVWGKCDIDFVDNFGGFGVIIVGCVD